jgi:DNA invertase Pin-like site-specific DNA recombinase
MTISMNMNGRAWIYTRVAHPDSAIEALEAQKKQLRHLAAEKGYEVVGYSGEVAGGMTLSRIGIQEVMVAADKGLFDVLLITNLSRISRTPADWDVFSKHFREIGVGIYSAADGLLVPQQHEYHEWLDSSNGESEQMHEHLRAFSQEMEML